MLKLYGSPNTRSTRVTWALEEAGAEYEFIHINLKKGEHKQPAFLSINPAGKIPALVDGDLVLSESAAICTYIGDKFPQSGLVPPVSDPANRALYLHWCFFAMTELEAPLWTGEKHAGLLPKERQVPAVIETCKWEFDRAAAVLTQHMQGREYAIGEGFTAADIIFARVLNWARGREITLNETLGNYADRMLARPAVARANAKESAA